MPTGDGTPRTYSIASDTANGVLNPGQLLAEIEADVAITTAVRTPANGGWLAFAGDVMDLWFSAALSAGEITALDAVVAAHQGTLTIRSFQFWESNPAQSTSLETYQNAISHTADSMGSGVYRLTWYCEMRVVASATLEGHAVLRFQIDGTSKGNAAVYNEEWHACSGWDRYFATEGEQPVLTIDFRRQGGGDDSVEIRKLKIGVEFMT